MDLLVDGIRAALKRAANGRMCCGGGATIRQYPRAGLIDEMHLAVCTILPGSGEHLFAGIDGRNLAIGAPARCHRKRHAHRPRKGG
jgi:dihydrofolate reductase